MKRVELYGRVRHAVMIEGLSQREAARCFGIDPRTVRKMLSYSVPPGYVRTRPPVRPKLDPFIGIIDRILEEDKDRPKKQRHTSKRIFERLRDEYGFTGKITIVKDYICGVRQRRREMFVPLTHPPGHAQVDFGEALAVIGGVERKIHFLAMSLPHSDACFVKAYPGETTEAFCDGHVSGFSFFGGVPRSILYDNTRIAVARILGDGKRQRTRVFSELRSHYLFEDRFGRPGKGNDKGKVEGIVGYCRRNFLVPMPRFRNFDDLNTHLEACCAKRWAEQLRGHDQTVGERLERDRAVLQRLPAIAYDACDKRPGRVSSLSLVRYRGTDYSVPTRFGHCEVLVRGYNRRRREALLLQEFPHQPNCRPSVPAGLNQEIQDFALTVHGTPEIELPPSNYDDHLVQVPAFGRSWPPTLNPPRIGPTEFQDPSSNCLIRDVETTLGKQVLNVPIAQRETAIEPDGMLDDDRWKAVTTVGYLAHPETLKHRPCRSHAVNVTMPQIPAGQSQAPSARHLDGRD